MPVVSGVEAIPIEVDIQSLEEGGIAPYVSNHDSIHSRHRMLIRVETDSGTVGWGELLMTMKSMEATKAIIDSVLAPELIGRSTANIRDFVESFYFPYTSIEPHLGGVEMALWDLRGKELGVPVYELLGGATRREVPVAYSLGILPPDESADHAARVRRDGYDIIKTKAGHDWREDVDRLVAMHEAVDGALEFRLDPNQGWSPEETVRVAAALENRGIYLQYLEQPMRVDTFSAYNALRSRIQTPIAVNEDTYSRFNLFHLLKSAAVDVAVVDIVPSGGILRTRELAALAEHAGVSVAHHNGFDLGIKTAAVLQTIAATPSIDLPPDTVYYAWDDHIITEPLTIADGKMAVPDDPGLGVTVDEERIAQLRTDGADPALL